ncbi:glycosyl hydrolase family 3 N terminal domain-containing protein [Diplogelasinospora grovesii]|uniref:beta-glucosidase n=1 Tax=Diplogelasinospora grovesii TaxID=303347 RepID=A0AAN6NGP7_9PEZI|nr:glycosyl hydrolase family 3 N terminal domain-containing protein [Diplogelasinospora grovesii]
MASQFSTSVLWLTLALSVVCNAATVQQQPRAAVPAGYVAAPYYPTPHGGWAASWNQSYAKAAALVGQMTLAEKTNITGGSGIYMGKPPLNTHSMNLYVPCVGNTGSALRLGFPQLCLQDSALGVASTDNVTAFPAGITTGATWDKSLIYARGVALGKEFRGKGANVYLGPTVGPLGRKPLGGRGWEGFGHDPVLQAVGGALTIKGVQEQGVIATVKHLIGNEQEMYRMYNPLQPGYSSNIDDRTLHELYLWPFAAGVRAGVGAVMSAYNAVNGSACSQNSYLLNGLLKDELGFQGFVMSDWLSHMSGVGSALAGLDMDMPGDQQIPLLGTSYWKYELTRAVLNGSVPVDRLDDMVTRVVAAWYQMGQDAGFGPPNFSANTHDKDGLLYPAALISPSGQVNWYVNVQADHYTVARQVAQDAVTMLKNNGSLLPLQTGTSGGGGLKLSVFGTDAQVNPDGPNACGNRACNVGTLGMGWGSGVADYPYLDDPITAIRKRVTNVTYYNTDSFPNVPAVGVDDVAVVFITSDSGENSFTVEGNHGDRDASKLAAWHGGDDLVKAVAGKYSNVVVVVHTVGPLILESWIDLPSVRAVLFAHLPGQEAGESLANVLFGDVSPSGHLPYSITKSATDLPDSVATIRTPVGLDLLGQVQDTYTEGLYIDYRYLNKMGTKARFAFGHGLSYTNFTFTNASIKSVTQLTATPPPRGQKGATPAYSTSIPPASEAYQPSGFSTVWRYLYSWLSKSDADSAYAVGAAGTSKYPYPTGYTNTQQSSGMVAGGGEGGNPALWDTAYEISVQVTNTGTKYSGKAVAQAYVQFPAGIAYDTPVVQLRDFEKTDTLAPGGTQTLTLTLTRKDVSVWDTTVQNWVVPGVGERFTIWVGEASDTLTVGCYTDSLACQAGLQPPV